MKSSTLALLVAAISSADSTLYAEASSRIKCIQSRAEERKCFYLSFAESDSQLSEAPGIQEKSLERMYESETDAASVLKNAEKEVEEAEKEVESALGLHVRKETLLVIALSVTNVIVFMSLVYYVWYIKGKHEMVMVEQKAEFYRQLHSYDKLVMTQYRDLDEMNKEMVGKTGKDELPRLKFVTDTNLLDIPMLAPFAYKKANQQLAGKKIAPRTMLDGSQVKLVNKIKLSIQKATSISQAADFERPYFESIEQLHKLREQPPVNALTRQKQFMMANMSVVDSVPDDSFRDRALGAFLGSIVADSSASYLGRLTSVPSNEELNDCLEMFGGGAHGLSAGQIRNCELQMCLLWGLVDRNMNFDKDRVLDLKSTLDFYNRWMQSEPPSEFAFGDPVLQVFETLRNDSNVRDVLKESKRKNRRSTSAESLLRLIPLAIWTSTVKNPYQVKKAIAAEASLVHQNKLVHSAIFIYFMALQCLLQNPRDEKRGAKAYDYAYELSKQELARGLNQGDSVREWLDVAFRMASSSDKEEVVATYLMQNFNCIDNPEDIKHAFILSFYFLLKSKPGKDLDLVYTKYLKQVIMLGGDVSTNAAIVMGMIGALIGVKRIPKPMLEKALSFDCTNEDPRVVNFPREEFLSVMMHGLVNLESLISLRPLNELIIEQ